jgi:membrane associated rhomboid family serine protease
MQGRAAALLSSSPAPASSAPACKARQQHQHQWRGSSARARPTLPLLPPPRAATPNGDNSGLDPEIEALLRKYDTESPKPSIPPRSKQQQQPPPQKQRAAAASATPAPRAPTSAATTTTTTGNGTFLLCFLCLLVFLADNLFHLPGMASNFHMLHRSGHLLSPWWTALTHSFAHANFAHLSSNLFPLLVFGKMVEETEGAFGVVFSFLATALGAALASMWLTGGGGAVVSSVGASGGVFGLFAVAVLTRFSPDPRRLLEFFVLGQFVVQQLVSEVSAQAAGGTMLGGGLAVSHVAHLGGALAGVVLILLLRSIPDVPDDG